MQYESVWPIGPDRCKDDRCAACYYLHLKRRALNGGRDRLSDEELAYVGIGVPSRDTSGGWHQPNDIAAVFLDQLSAEVALASSLRGSAERWKDRVVHFPGPSSRGDEPSEHPLRGLSPVLPSVVREREQADADERDGPCDGRGELRDDEGYDTSSRRLRRRRSSIS